MTTLTYDQDGLVIMKATSGSGTTSYTYQNGLVASITNPTGASSTLGYDAAGRLTGITDTAGKRTRIVYDDADNITSIADPLGNTTSFTYNSHHDKLTQTDPKGNLTRFVYNGNGKLVSSTNALGKQTRYEYDGEDRLIGVINPNGTVQTQAYDAAGQLTEQKDTDKNGAIISHYTFAYDNAGNITEEKNAVGDYTYDARNRLVKAGTLRYTYDAENNRVATAEGAKTTNYVINPNAPLSQVLIATDGNGTQTYYVYGLGLIGQETGGSYKTYHFDRRGSTIALTDENGVVTDTLQYAPYGELVARTGISITPFLFNGKYGVMTDSNGLYYMRARYYNPETKRFVNQDVLLGSVADGQSLNRYAFVNGNPINRIDPTGEAFVVDDVIIIGGAVVVITAGVATAEYLATPEGQEMLRSLVDEAKDDMQNMGDQGSTSLNNASTWNKQRPNDSVLPDVLIQLHVGWRPSSTNLMSPWGKMPQDPRWKKWVIGIALGSWVIDNLMQPFKPFLGNMPKEANSYK